jgi:hypothetical protein
MAAFYVQTNMKSGKQRRQEIREKRRKKADALKVDTYAEARLKPIGAVEADHLELVHNNTYGPLPNFYVDRSYVCRDCSSDELWTAKQQKWWYEIAKGDINSIAVRCRRCRNALSNQKEEQKRHMKEMASRKPHPNESFFKKK